MIDMIYISQCAHLVTSVELKLSSPYERLFYHDFVLILMNMGMRGCFGVSIFK